jgi:hypothetical protein
MYYAIDPDSRDPTSESFREKIVEAVSDATSFSDMILDASDEEDNQRAAIALYDRVASQMTRDRAILRSARSGDVAAANELFFGSEAGPFTDSNSQWIITSTTTRDGVIATENTDTDLRSIKSYALIAMSAICVLSAAVLFAWRSSKRRSIVLEVNPSASTAKWSVGTRSETPDNRIDRIDALKHVL